MAPETSASAPCAEALLSASLTRGGAVAVRGPPTNRPPAPPYHHPTRGEGTVACGGRSKIIEPDSSKEADAKYHNRFSGYDLSCEHDRRANPFRRNEQFEARTCHRCVRGCLAVRGDIVGRAVGRRAAV